LGALIVDLINILRPTLWIEHAIIDPGEENQHHWFWDPMPLDVWRGHTFQFTAYGLPWSGWGTQNADVRVVQVYVLVKGIATNAPGETQLNVIVQNFGPSRASYDLWGTDVPPNL